MLVALFIGSNFGHFYVPWYLWLYALVLDLAIAKGAGTSIKIFQLKRRPTDGEGG